MISSFSRLASMFFTRETVKKLKNTSLFLRSSIHFPIFMWRKYFGLRVDEKVVLLLSMGWGRGSPILARELHRRGYKVVLVSLGVPSYEMKYIWDWIKIDATQFSQLESNLEIFKKRNALLVLSEMKNILLPGVCYLSHQLGLPGISEKGAATSNSKILFRQSLDSNNLNNLYWGVVGKDVVDRFPVIVKPEKGTGSRGVALVTNQQEYSTATNVLEAGPLVGGRFMFEEMLEGDQYDIEGVTQNGSHFVAIRVFEKYEKVDGKFPTGWYLLNCPLTSEKRERMDDYVKSCLDALGVTDGAWHLELKEISPNKFAAIDYSNRMGYPDLISSAIGQSFPGLYVESLNRTMSMKLLAEKKQYMVFQKYIHSEAEAISFRRLAKDKGADIVEYKDTRNVVAGVNLYGRIALRCSNLTVLFKLLDQYGVRPHDFVISSWDKV